MKNLLKITALATFVCVASVDAKAQDGYEYAIIYSYQPIGTTDNTRDIYVEYSDRAKEIIELGLLRTKFGEITQEKLNLVSKKVKDGWEVITITEGAEGITYHLRKKK